MRVRVPAALAGVVVVVAAASVVALRGGDEPPGSSPRAVSEHPVAPPPAVRTVLVFRAMPTPSAHARRLSTMLEEGAMPGRPTMAEVLTDTDCTPDARMISRCRNLVRLDDGRQIVLRHPHDMSKVPCLAPDERVRLIPSAV